MATTVSAIAAEYGRYKLMAEGAIRQLDDGQLRETLGQTGGNDVATLVRHIAGNLESRFSDFLTGDGEKPWRDRDAEFAPNAENRAEILQRWERGWTVLLDSLAALSDADLSRTVAIRGQSLEVREALQRSLAHTSFHVGQIVMLARALCGSKWQFLSIPPGGSAQYNQNPVLEKAPREIR